MKTGWVIAISGMVLVGLGATTWAAQARPNSCTKRCSSRAKQQHTRCVAAYRERIKACRRWSAKRLRLCATTNIRSRRAFCGQVYGERIARCVRWHQSRTLRCKSLRLLCERRVPAFCRGRCKGASSRSCRTSCQNQRKKRCAAEVAPCRKRSTSLYKRCVGHAASRRAICFRSVRGSVQGCRAFARRSVATCFQHANARRYACRKRAQVARKACRLRCKK